MRGAFGVDREDLRAVFLVLGGVDRRPGGAVDHRVGLFERKRRRYGVPVGDVERQIPRVLAADVRKFRQDVRADDRMAARRKLPDDVVAELAADACDKYLHPLSPYIF